MNSRALRLLIAIVSIPLAIGARKRPEIPAMGERIEVAIVNVDVVVTDKNGNRVRGLTQDDFQIFEDGDRREVSNFAEYTTAPADTDDPPPPSQRRTVLVFIEKANVAYDATRFFESIRETLRATVRRGDSAAVIVWAPTHQLRVDFTDELHKIDAVLETLKRDISGPQRDDSEELAQDIEDIMRLEEQSNVVGGLAEETVTPVNERPVIIERVGNMESLSERARMKRKVTAINAAINSMAPADGKKLLILATHRLSDVTRGDFYYEAGEDLLAQDVRARFSTRDLVDSIIRNANAGGVTIYPVYPTGVERRERGGEYRTVTNEMLSLARVARQTGGLEASGPIEFAGVMQRLEDDLTDYYSLAYKAEARRMDRSRDIVVRTKDPRLVVRSRRSYVEKSDETRMKDRLMGALIRTSNDSMFLIEAELGEAKKARRSVDIVPLQVRIPIGALTAIPEDGKRVGAFSIYVLSGAMGEQTSSVRQQTHRFEIPATEYAEAVPGHFTYTVHLLLNREANRLAVGVIDELSKSYSVLRVPVPPRGQQAAMQ